MNDSAEVTLKCLESLQNMNPHLIYIFLLDSNTMRINIMMIQNERTDRTSLCNKYLPVSRARSVALNFKHARSSFFQTNSMILS
jgi:hypothetical protein